MAHVRVAEIDELLEGWKSGSVSSEHIERWARRVRTDREPESEAVNEVLARLQVLARIDVGREDVLALQRALRAPDAGALLHAHFGARAPVALPEGRAHMSLKGDPLLRQSARRQLETASHNRSSLRRILAAAMLLAVLAGIWLERTLDFEVLGEMTARLLLVAAFAGFAIFCAVEARRPALRCPFCRARWRVSDDETWRELEKGRCPRCRTPI